MLSIVDSLTVPGGTAYRDDEAWHRFYIVPSLPRVRRQADGAPVFLLVSYQFTDDERAADKTLPIGQGYLQFDVELKLGDDDAEATRRMLQQRVDAEHARRRADPKYAADPLVQVPTPPTVELADPLWSGGTVKIQTTTAAGLVQHIVSEQPAAVLTGNNAVFNLDLTAAGLDFFHQLFLDDAGADLTAVQVIYSLKMWARLPDFAVSLTANSERAQKVYDSVKTTNADEPCTPAEVETLQQKAFSAASLRASGVIEFHTSAPPGVPPEAITAVQQQVYSLFDSMVREQFLTPVTAEGEPLPLDDGIAPRANDSTVAWLYPEPGFAGTPVEVRADAPALGGVQVRSVSVRQGYRVTLFTSANYAGTPRDIRGGERDLGDRGMTVRSARVVRPPESRSRVRTVENTSEFNVSINLTQSQIVEWAVNPAATLEPTFAGLPSTERKKHFVELDRTGFRLRPITLRPIANFTRLAAVLVEVEYAGTGTDGRRIVKAESKTFTPTDTAPWRLDWSQVGDSRTYRYRYQTTDAATNRQSPWSAYISADGSDVPVVVVEPGAVDLQVSGAALDWQLIRLAVVSMRVPLEDGSAATQTAQLTPTAPNATWRTSLPAAPTGPIELEYQFHLADARQVGPIRDTAEVSQNLVVVRDPNIDVLNVVLIPGGDWSEVTVASVTLTYVEADGTVKDNSFQLTSAEQLIEWKVPLRDPTRRDFTWACTIAWKTDRPPEVRPPRAASGDQTIAIVVKGRPKPEVTVNPGLLDFKAYSVVQVNLNASTGAAISCAFSKGAPNPPFVWKIPVEGNQEPTWSWEAIAHSTDGQEVRTGVRPGEGTLLLVPPPDIQAPGTFAVQVRGNFVDLATTPIVSVELKSSASGHEESGLVEIADGSRSGNWTANAAAGAPHRYTYAITYFLADGTPVPGESGTSESPLLVIKAYKPPA